ARTHGYLLKTGHFGVSVLARGQERLSAHYGGCPDPQLDPQLEPIGRTRGLAGAAAIIGADVIARHECGDHSIFIGQIVEMRANPGVVPLVLHAGRFASLAYTGEADFGPIVEFW